MIRTWPGQTKEEWMAEYQRNQSLTAEEREKELNDYLNQLKQKEAKSEQMPQKINKDNFFGDCDSFNGLENEEATAVWIVAMILGAFFKGNWVVWIIATIVWLRYITRNKRKK